MKMMMNKTFFKYIAIINLIVVAVFYNDIKAIISVQVALFSNLVIVLLSFKAYKAKILMYVPAIDMKSLEEDESDYKSLSKLSFATFSLYRIFSYILLIVLFFYIKNNDLLMPIAYFIGLSITPLASLLWLRSFKNK